VTSLPEPGTRYVHFKGGRYEVTGTALDAHQNARPLVIYRALDGENKGTVWVRSVRDFIEKVCLVSGKSAPLCHTLHQYVPNHRCQLTDRFSRVGK
jgi:hypothetical protein